MGLIWWGQESAEAVENCASAIMSDRQMASTGFFSFSVIPAKIAGISDHQQ
jgi:hypothetical protein